MTLIILLRWIANNDNLLGGTGNDILDGGTGTDMLIGGADADTYLLHSANVGVTTIDDTTGTLKLDGAVFAGTAVHTKYTIVGCVTMC